MNDEQQAELRAMREEQRTLRQRLGALDERLVRLESQAAEALVTGLSVTASPVAAIPTTVPPLQPDIPPPLPPLPLAAKAATPEPVSLADIAADAGWRATKPPLLPPASTPQPITPPVAWTTAKETPGSVESAGTAPSPQPRESLEMRIGATWLVWAGVFLALTALAFLGSYLYQNVVPHLGPVAKVALLYVGAAALTGAGAWLERSRQARDNPRLHDFSQVVLAGGLAAVYYVTYIAHYFERLRVIENSLLAGAMLLAWTAFMVFLAHRRNSELLATVAILLAYYTAAINDGVQAFTLFSNLALTGGVIFLLRRHLWKVFPFASLLATFGSYGFWSFYHSGLGARDFEIPPVHSHHVGGGFWIEAAFLFVYWALFTWAAFSTGEKALPSLRRAGFVSLNNSAFFLLTTWLVLGEGPGWFWKWSLGFGAVLLAMAEVYRRFARPPDARAEDAYLLQGVLLLTLGFVAYFDGWQLSLVLAVQAVAILAAAGRRSSAPLLGCSVASALLAFLCAMGSFDRSPATGEWVTPLGMGVVLVGAAYLAQRLKERPTGQTGIPTTFRKGLDPAPAYYSLLGCVVWLWLIGKRAPETNAGILEFTGAALALTASVYLLRIRALTIYAQAFLGVGFLVWASEDLMRFSPTSVPNTWTTLAPLLSALALGHWWQWLPGATGWQRSRLSGALSGLDAVLTVGTVFVWYISRYWQWQSDGSMAAAGLAGLALTVFAYAVATRYRALALASQGLLLAGTLAFFQAVNSNWDGSSRVALLASVPLLAILAMLTAGRYLVPTERTTWSTRTGTVCYELLATLLFLVWVGRYLPDETLMPVYVLAGALVFALGVDRAVKRWTLLSIVPTAVGVWVFLAGNTEAHGSFLALLGVAGLAAQQQFGKRRLGDHIAWFRPGWQAALMGAATLCAWVFISARVGKPPHGAFTLAASWSLFAAAVFAAGLLLHERIYRWLGLLVMAATFVHIVVFDLAQLDSLGKAISFFALSMVALGVGYLYIKYQSKFRDLL